MVTTATGCAGGASTKNASTSARDSTPEHLGLRPLVGLSEKAQLIELPPEDRPRFGVGTGSSKSLGLGRLRGAPSGAAPVVVSMTPNSSTATAAAAAEAAAAAGGSAYQELLAWVYSPDSKVTRADLDASFLEDFVACPIAAQRVLLGYLRGRAQQGMYDRAMARAGLLTRVLKDIAGQVSGPPPFQQLEALLSAPVPGHPIAWHGDDVGSQAIEAFLACPVDVQHMVLQVTT